MHTYILFKLDPKYTVWGEEECKFDRIDTVILIIRIVVIYCLSIKIQLIPQFHLSYFMRDNC